MVSKPLEALFEWVFKVLLQKNSRFYGIFKKNKNVHAALDWEVMFLTEFSTWKLKIPERKTYKNNIVYYIIFIVILYYI